LYFISLQNYKNFKVKRIKGLKGKGRSGSGVYKGAAGLCGQLLFCAATRALEIQPIKGGD